jgi:hypothetical protein
MSRIRYSTYCSLPRLNHEPVPPHPFPPPPGFATPSPPRGICCPYIKMDLVERGWYLIGLHQRVRRGHFLLILPVPYPVRAIRLVQLLFFGNWECYCQHCTAYISSGCVSFTSNYSKGAKKSFGKLVVNEVVNFLKSACYFFLEEVAQ